MATAADKNLITQVLSSAQALDNAIAWARSGRPLNVEGDFLFEIYVLLELVKDIKNKYDVEYLQGTGRNKNYFPRKPAKKNGRPRFNVYRKTDRSLLWQICAGTQISDIHGKDRAPDITIQDGNASDTPTHKDVRLIWDAKYRHDPKDRITHADFSEFGHFLELLALRNAPKPAIQFSRLAQLLANCLITNGLESTEPDAECNRQDMKEVCGFYPGKHFVVRP